MASSSFLLVVLLMIEMSASLLVSGFEFHHDASPEICHSEAMADPGVCTRNETMWFSCPISCAQMLFGGRGTMSEERTDPEQFYELHANRATTTNNNTNIIKGDAVSLEDNEGYITLYAVLPMLPGMAQYYYDAIEHIAHVYKYTLVTMILPYYNTDNHESESSSTSSTILRSILDLRKDDNDNKNTKSILLEAYDARQKSDNTILEYLLTREVVAGNLDFDNDNENPDNDYNDNDNMLLMTRPNIFLVSHNGMFIERIVSPTMELIERRIKVHELAMEDDFEL